MQANCGKIPYACDVTRAPGEANKTRRLAEVAKKVGVSEATVSRVLNGKPGVSDATRAAVIVRTLGRGEPGAEGVLVLPDDPRALAREISALMANPAKAARLGAAARAQAQTFSFTRMVTAFERVYLNAPDAAAIGASRLDAVAKS